MLNGIPASLSGMSALGKKHQVAANNVANAHTDGFKKSRAELVEAPAPALGVEVRFRQSETPGPEVFEDTPEGKQLVEQSNVDLGEEMANLLVAQGGFEMNVAALRVQEESLGTLMDIIG